MDCHNCGKFVLSGADLLYWRRKREQWRLIAEGAPGDTAAAYLHSCFEPTARAIDGLEKALAGLGLLNDALALDLRKPQDYFHASGTPPSGPPTSPEPAAKTASAMAGTRQNTAIPHRHTHESKDQRPRPDRGRSRCPPRQRPGRCPARPRCP
jgi:hypothetical protein